MRLGDAFNPLSSTNSATCLASVPPVSACSGGARRTASIRFVTDTASLKSTLGLSAAASYGDGLFGAEASASYYRSEQVESNSVYLVLDVQVTYTNDTVATPQLSASALSLLSSDPQQFVARCGTEYVASITSGGFFRAVYAFHSVRTSDVTSLATSFDVGGGDWSASASLETSIQSASSHYDTNLFVTQAGGTLTTLPTTPTELMNAARNFGVPSSSTPGITCSTAVPISVQTNTYYTTANFPTGGRYADVTSQLNELNSLAPKLDQERVLRNDLTDRLRRPGQLLTSACAADYAQYTDLQTALSQYEASAQRKHDACLLADVCGPDPLCVATLADPPTMLPRLSDPVHCGPACTDGSSSTFESDEFGYCTRCTWTWPSTSTAIESMDGLMRSSCRYMRPGAHVAIRAQGPVTRGSCSTDSEFYAQLQLYHGSPNSRPICCTNGAAQVTSGSPFTPSMFDEGDIDLASSPPEMDAWINQNHGTGQPGCSGLNYGTWTIDICDADRPGGCPMTP